MLVHIVITVLFLIGCVIWWCFDSENHTPFILSIFLGVLLGCLVTDSRHSKNPTALDVYRGKTTLEITYRDSVAIDSTVVYKVR